MFSEYALVLSIMAFFATSVDDFCVLLIFFSREYAKTNNLSDPATQQAFTNICIGQFIGFTIIVTVALAIGIGLSQSVDEDWIDLIGFIPMLIGCYLIYELLLEAGYFDRCCPNQQEEESDKESDLEEGLDSSIDEKMPLVGFKDEEVKKPTKHVTIEEPSTSDVGSGLTPSGQPTILTKSPSFAKKLQKRVSIDERNNTTDVESKEGGPSGDGGDSPSAAGGGSGGGSPYTNIDESDVDNAAKQKSKPRRKRTLSADLSGRYFESLNDRIDVSNALGEAMSDNKGGGGKYCPRCGWINCCLDPLAQEVVLYVLIFGIDNLAIFTVLFANVSEIEIVVVIVVFYLLLFFYIALTIVVLIQCPGVGHWFGNNVRYLVPFVLIGFGIYILYGSVIWQPSLE